MEQAREDQRRREAERAQSEARAHALAAAARARAAHATAARAMADDWARIKGVFAEARVNHMLRAAIQILGSREAAERWMERSEPAMGGASPREYVADRSDGIALAEAVLRKGHEA